MTEITPEALEALIVELRCGDPSGAKCDKASDMLIKICRALRTGQLIHAVPSGDEVEAVACKFNLGDRVTKTKGSSWTGLVVGFYSTSITPIGYAVESENEPGSVQIYPESALDAVRGKQ